MPLESGVYTYACPMPPQDNAQQPWFVPVPVVPWPWPCVPVQPSPPAVPPVVVEPVPDADLTEAEELFEIAVRRVREAIRRQREGK